MPKKYLYGLTVATIVNIILYIFYVKLSDYTTKQQNNNVKHQVQLNFLHTLQTKYTSSTLRTVVLNQHQDDIDLEHFGAMTTPYFITIEDIKRTEGRIDISLIAMTDCDVYQWLQHLSSLGYVAHYIALFYRDQDSHIVGKISLNKDYTP